MKRFDLTELKPGAHIHFIGIGGISMSGLAVILLKNGCAVSGSDREKTHITEKLEKMGAKIFIGHDEKNVRGADLVVHTAAVHSDNPEMMAAMASNIRLIDRAECLGAVMKQYKKAVGISGTHGKTTTTGMLTHALMYAQTDPTVSIGGELDIIGGNIRAGSSEYFITEACEYTNSFLKFFPKIAVITNIEEDHLDFFSGIEQIKESFAAFASLVGEDGWVVANGDDENIIDALKNTKGKIVYYGKGSNCDYTYDNVQMHNGFPEFDVLYKGEKKEHIVLNVPGMHNVMNALSVVAVCDIFGIDSEIVTKGIASFKGTHRRFENLGTLNGAPVIADYAHHPTEIKATIQAAKAFEAKRTICVFQPHTYSRTRSLWEQFVTCFDGADQLIITHIYAAREQFDGITKAENLAKDIDSHGVKTVYIEEFSDICDYLKANVTKGDMVLVLGAGNVIDVGYEVVK